MRMQAARLLVRGAVSNNRLSAAGNRFQLAGPPAGETAWNVFEADGRATIPELWDAAYEAGGEPDCENLWPLPVSDRERAVLAGRGGDPDRGVVNQQSGSFPKGPGFGWHLDDEYSQLRKARNSVGPPAPVRGAILDVGFDFNHRSRPEHLRRDLERNFSGEGDHTAADPDQGGFLENPGHGTATIALFAGGKLDHVQPPTPSGDFLGGAPGIEVVPIRVATGVVLLRTSAFADAIQYLIRLNSDPSTAVDVVSMSMGGVASGAWADAVNQAYQAGITIVTAAGNNFGRPKSIVFPARFRRVLAVCGAMADFRPYDLPLGTMSGNYGPDGKMDTAIAAFTPNIPWAEINSPAIVDWDGEGTSSATPQVAAAVALWFQKHKRALAGWAPWQRVEMVRRALFQSADRSKPDSRKYFGQGLLKAFDALQIAPSEAIRATLQRQEEDSASFAFFRALRGTIFGAAAESEGPLDAAFNIEMSQLMHRDPELEGILPDPAAGFSDDAQRRRFAEAVIASPHASRRLRAELEKSFSRPSGSTPPAGGFCEYKAAPPSERQLRVYAIDPSATRSLDTAGVATATIAIPWEDLEPGPSGEYIEVIDHDPASGCFYAPVDLEDRFVLASDGLAPAMGNPKFHQQMVYAVAMRTIRSFETALGRRALWSPRMNGRKEVEYVGKLRIYPHALRARNAFYNPLKKALLFGYFPASPVSLATTNPGGMVFTCLSHDIVAHETAHALLDGMARGLVNPTNPDMLAFHEAFADIVALFQHFSLPGVLTHELARTRGSLRGNSFLVELAREFGEGAGLHGALRSYIGQPPDPNLLAMTLESHDRGAILVAAVFDAFVSIYERRIADLRRIASGGTGILPEGDIHPDLVNRFAAEAAVAARHVLRMCIRAIDYCPPVDQTFGDYLRALITADCDLYPTDSAGYRTALVEAFRKRGIYPRDIRAMSEDALKWRAPSDAAVAAMSSRYGQELLKRLGRLGDKVRRLSRDSVRRSELYELLRTERAGVHDVIADALRQMPAAASAQLSKEFGIYDPADPGNQSFEVRALNFADREDGSGAIRRDLFCWLQHERDGREGGCTLIADCDTGEIRYLVRKSFASETRQQEVEKFRQSGTGMTYFADSPLAGPGARFAVVHESGGGTEEGYA